MEVNRKEVERYLGYRGVSVIDDKMSSIIEECIEDMKREVTPREIHKTFPFFRNKGRTGQSCEESEGMQ